MLTYETFCDILYVVTVQCVGTSRIAAKQERSAFLSHKRKRCVQTAQEALTSPARLEYSLSAVQTKIK